MPYKLSATLVAHSADVRAVASPSNDLIVSASRDTTAICWSRTSGSTFTSTAVLNASDRYVNAITYIPPSPDAPQGYVVTGGQDKIINAFSLASGDPSPAFTLIGHSDNVCALHSLPNGTIISGSWDKTAKVWKNFKCTYDLKGHTFSVWTVLAIDDEHFLTGSADKTIKLWQQDRVTHIYEGHQDAVRGLLLIPDIGFASCSNDSEIRVWTLGGDTVYTLSGHTSFIYSLSILPDGAIVSCGEDRTVRIWRDGDCSQTIVHPAVSVWSVSTMPNGDIVSGSSDSVVRIFSASEDRWASPEDIKEYEDSVAKQALPAQQIGNVKVADMPGMEALAQPGAKSGQTKMIRNGDKVEAYQWDAEAFTWQQIGEVLKANDEDDEYKGYDHVWDVDMGDNRMLKLPYNESENPYVAAQRFLERNNIPMAHLDTVVQHIEQNSRRSQLASNNTQYIDPYTGASRYTASSSSVPTVATSSYMDPYTGASRYSGSPSVPAASPAQSPRLAILPAREPRSMNQANVNAMQAKMYDIDESLRNEISVSSYAMYPQELRLIDEAFAFLSHATSTSPVPPTTLNANHIEAIMSILDRWPASPRYPVIDLSRLIVAYSSDSISTPELRIRWFEALFASADWNEPWTTPLSKSRETNILLLLRALANAFSGVMTVGSGEWVKLVMQKLIDARYEVLSPKARVVGATVLYNLSCMMLREPINPELRSMLFSLLFRIIRTEKEESEAYYRAVVALGNVVYATKEQNSPLDSTQLAEVREAIAVVPSQFNERTRLAVLDINALL